MAVYKVPQDVEADDKLIGPFSFKQFVFVLLFIGLIWLAWLMASVSPFLALIPLPFALAFLVLGLPLRKDQPTDVYVAALINFWMRPKTRLWGQEGMLEHVEITAPKKVEHYYGDGLSVGEVKSRLDTLAKTIDTRGWSSKNAAMPGGGLGYGVPASSDRLVAPSLVSNEPVVASEPVEDMLDTQNSRVAQNFAKLEAAAASHDVTAAPQAAIEQVQGADPTAPGSVFMPGQASTPTPNPDELTVADSGQPLAAPDFNPYPSSIQQHVVNPLGPDNQPSNPTPTTDIIDDSSNNNGSTGNPTDVDLNQGGEVSLH